MNSITNEEAKKLVHRLRTDKNLIWNFRAKVILILPKETVSIKNRIELIRALREHGYLQGDETLDREALEHFRMEAKKEMLDAEDFFERFREAEAEADLKANRHNITGLRQVLKKHVGDMEYDDYLTAVVTA